MRNSTLICAATILAAALAVLIPCRSDSFLDSSGQTVHPAPVDQYAIATDGGLVYNPLTREAIKTGQLKEYNNVPRIHHQLDLGGCHIDLQVPKHAIAYDVIPIPYTLSWKQGAQFPLGIEADAFEDVNRTHRKPLYDTLLPHNIDLSCTLTGTVTAKPDPALKQIEKADFTDKPGTYPPFVRDSMAHSGTIGAGNLVWFKFHMVNTGDTILTAEGAGGTLLFPELLKEDSNGVYQHYNYSENLYYRNVNKWYPGESWDPWIYFPVTSPGPDDPLPPGNYKVRLMLACRSYRTTNASVNASAGPIAYTFDQPITVEATPRQTPILAGAKAASAGDFPDKLPTFIHTYEQFMSSYDLLLKTPVEPQNRVQGVLHLQVAPWTRNVILKLVGSGSAGITTAIVPISIDDDAPKLAIKPDMHNTVTLPNGRRWPVFETQIMSDMRANVQVTPYPEQYIAGDLQHMKDLGVNVLCTTEAPWFYQDFDIAGSSMPGDSAKYALDIAREKHIQLDAWGLYPPDRATALQDEATAVSGIDYHSMASIQAGWGAGGLSVNPIDPLFPQAYAALVHYDFRRWGDLFYQAPNGAVPVDTEDTRGWMSDGIDAHFPVGTAAVAVFRTWVQAKYKTIASTNAAWGSSFASFDAIDPETHQADLLMWTYRDQTYPFHEWNQALADYDEWRTGLRVALYQGILRNVRKDIPNATMELRTEGGNIVVAGLDPESSNPHIRWAYYIQHRGALIGDTIVKSHVIGFHSDYMNVAYTPSELSYFVKLSVKQGIVPTYLPEFVDMLDPAINDQFGNDYQTTFNLPTPKKEYMFNVLEAAYPWFKVMDENGGIPGLLWEDFECNGFVADTQMEEMKFLQHKLHEALDHLPITKQHTPNQAWRKGSLAKQSYILTEAMH